MGVGKVDDADESGLPILEAFTVLHSGLPLLPEWPGG